jgi:hypothetical protein
VQQAADRVRGVVVSRNRLIAGTLRLTWNQSVTRTRWMAAKLGLVGLVGLAAMATAGLLSLMVSWWAGPIDQAGGFPVTMGQLSRFSPLVFDARGLAPVGYAAFAFTLGVTVGVLTRRTLGIPGRILSSTTSPSGCGAAGSACSCAPTALPSATAPGAATA